MCVCVLVCLFYTNIPHGSWHAAQTFDGKFMSGSFLIPAMYYLYPHNESSSEMSFHQQLTHCHSCVQGTSTTPFPGWIPSHFVPLTWRLNTACRTHSCPPSTNSWSMMPSLPKNAISKTCKFNLAVWYLFGKGDDVAYHLDDCYLVSGSSKYQTFTSCNNLPLEAVILHWLFSLLATVPAFPSIVSKQLQNKLCTD